MQIDSNDPDEDPCLRTLLGQGIPPNEPEINCEDLMPFDYGSKTVGFCTPERTWLLINEGMADLTGTILLAGPDAVEFEFTRGRGWFQPAGWGAADYRGPLLPADGGREERDPADRQQ